MSIDTDQDWECAGCPSMETLLNENRRLRNQERANAEFGAELQRQLDTARAEVEQLQSRLATELHRNRQLQDRNDALELSRNAEAERLRGVIHTAWLRAEKRGYQELIDLLEPALGGEG